MVRTGGNLPSADRDVLGETAETPAEPAPGEVLL